MDSFWAGFGWIVGGMFAMVIFAVVGLFVLFAVTKWLDEREK